MEEKQPTNQELLQAIQALSTHVDEELQDVKDAMQLFSTNVDEQFAKVDQQFAKVDGQFAKVDGQFAGINSRLTRVEATMVTKDYLDTKLTDLRGDLTMLVRKEDRKVLALVDELREKNTISEEGAKRISRMEPFPQLG